MAFLEEILLVFSMDWKIRFRISMDLVRVRQLIFLDIECLDFLFSSQVNDLGSLRCWIRFSKDDQDDNTKIAFVFRGS